MRRFLVHPPQGEGPLRGHVLVLWHGAGGDIDQSHLSAVARAAAADGAFAVRARFAHRIAGKKAPDRMPKLVAHARETVEQAVAASGGGRPRLILGGRSMGGRVASMMVTEASEAARPVEGLLFLSYPLHPAGKPEQRRDAHLPGFGGRMLFVAGDRDALARLDLLRPVVERLGPRARLEVFEGANHGFSRVPVESVVDVTRRWWSASDPSGLV